MLRFCNLLKKSVAPLFAQWTVDVTRISCWMIHLKAAAWKQFDIQQHFISCGAICLYIQQYGPAATV